MGCQPDSKEEERVEDPHKPPTRATQIGLAVLQDQHGWQKIEPNGEYWYCWRFQREITYMEYVLCLVRRRGVG